MKDKKTDWFIFPSFEYFSAEQLTKEVKKRLVNEGKKCIGVYFDMTESEFHKKINSL